MESPSGTLPQSLCTLDLLRPQNRLQLGQNDRNGQEVWERAAIISGEGLMSLTTRSLYGRTPPASKPNLQGYLCVVTPALMKTTAAMPREQHSTVMASEKEHLRVSSASMLIYTQHRHARTHTRTHTRTHMHMHIHACTHTHTHVHTCTGMHTHS